MGINQFDRMVDQLRYGGVLEAVKVARAGYPTRFALKDFVRRYFMLAKVGCGLFRIDKN